MSEQTHRLRIVYFGSGAFGIPTLSAIAQRHEVLAAVTQPDRPAGRSRRPTPTPVAEWLAERSPGTHVIKPESVNHSAIVSELHALPADAYVVIAFGQKLGQPLLAGRFAINLHASLLPRWRGAAPINWAIVAGDSATGNSVITVAERMDAGAVLGQTRLRIDDTVTAGELHDRLAEDGAPLMLRVLEEYAEGRLAPQPQDESKVTLARKLSRADAVVDWSQPARLCARRINGLSPWPGVSVSIGGQQVKLLRATIVEGRGPTSGEPGALASAREGLVVSGEGSLTRLLEVQPAGGRAMAWAEFARGRNIPEGGRLEAGAQAC